MIRWKAVALFLALILIALGLVSVFATDSETSDNLSPYPHIAADRVYGFRDGIAAVIIYEDTGAFRLGYINQSLDFVIPYKTYGFDPHWQTPQFSYGLVPVRSDMDGAVGFFNIRGVAVTPFMYEAARDFSEGLAAVRYGGQWGFIDTYGDIHIPFRYDRAGDFSEGVAPVMLNGRWGFIDTEGELAIPFVLEHYYSQGDNFMHPGFSEDLVPVLFDEEEGPRWGFLTRAGNRMHSYLYHGVHGFVEGRALVMGQDHEGHASFGYINQQGEEIVPPVYDLGRDFSEGLAAVSFNGGWGFIDEYGRVQVPVRYEYARSFSQGLAAVMSGGLWGFIDRWGNEVIPLIYSGVGDFAYGAAAVRLGEDEEARWGFVSPRGEILFPIEFTEVTDFSEYLAWARASDGWSMIEISQTDDMAYAPRYIYQPVPEYLRFTPQPHTIDGIYDPAGAEDAILAMALSLTPEQRTSGDALNIVTLYIENAIRRGTSQELPVDGILSAEILQNGAYIAQNLWQSALATTNAANLHLMRQLGVNINFIASQEDVIAITFPEDVSTIGFDSLTVEMEFGAVTISREDIMQGGEVIIERGTPVSNHFIGEMPLDPVLLGFAFRHFLTSPVSYLLEYWAIIAIALLILLWGILATIGHRFRIWVVPVFAVLFILGNLWTLRGNQQENEEIPAIAEDYVYSVIITMSPGMRATVSIPLNGADQGGLMILGENGKPQLSRYNPVTNTIDARISSDGTFVLGRNETVFMDIVDADPMVQEAIFVLASMGIMTGVEGYFHPDSAITRGELALALVTSLGLPTDIANNIFPDNNPEDMYYHAIATVAYHGLINGFGDGHFRGSWAIPKSDLVVVLGRVLTEHMGYRPPVDIGGILARYQDLDRIDVRAQTAIALVTATNILVEREDGRFAPESVMTRGDAAVVIYRLFGRMWNA
ncbi:MAG: WG repeat-containing protein [Defluviitaleaceae bacterium]|nr:WG repeat-containing protein [Defluviitaleaceae bacterium]